MTPLSLVDEKSSTITPSFRAGSGSPVVLLHGITMSWRAWKPVLPFLTGRHDVFAPTLAGHRGGPDLPSDAPPGVTSVVDTLCDQLDEAGIESAHLVGNSLGGWVALELARRGRARSVIGLSPAGTWRARRDLVRLIWMFRAGHMAIGSPHLSWMARNPLLRGMALSQMIAHPGRVPEDEVAELLADFENCALFAALLDGTAALHHLAEFDVALCPVKIAWGQKDRLIPYNRYGRPMRETVRGAEFTMLPGVGHVPMYDDPRLVARTILETTTSVDAAYQVPERPTSRRRSA
ncbi:alpha/beta fold hydrolase [Pseudonocardia spinosispora]|uniref:alpha/beta fold hydrolase n=1 Tax=Pseudonocardia spinosispora TaxID=103441 RepID=UPI0007E8DDA6|nr:alpha/beta hydrolase [Pseudonocardia spinosispora]